MRKRNKLDRENLRQVILDSHRQFAEGIKRAKNIKVSGNFTSLEISGMGGSSLPANILRIYLNDLYLKNPGKNKRFGIFQNRSYSLPHEAYNNCLNFFASYSGNTEETLFSLNEAVRAKLPIICFTTGGKMKELCEKHKLPCVILPAGIQPRYATGYFFAAMFQALVNCKMVEDKGKDLVKLAEKIRLSARSLEDRGKKIARKLVGKTPIIYSTPKYKSLAMIWKIKINENAKTPAFYNFFPELNHNEMVGWTLTHGKFHVITLINKDTHPQNIRRMKITAKLMKKNGIDTTFVEMENSNTFFAVFSTLILGDWTSFHLALEYGQDPTPVDMVEDFKEQLT